MRIVQTFWTAGQDPLKHSFGWSHPQYNLMSWALSCLSLREHYDDVELYTDSAGYHILIEVLGLPYTKTHVVFDDFKCLPHHWALAKIKTYSMQTEPFIHVDGDVYLPQPLPKEIENAPLVAQNEEECTDYYRRMVEQIVVSHEILLYDWLDEQINATNMPSYNMGIFGGSDLEFIHTYCKKVFNFMEINHINDQANLQSSANCNVFIEQIFFASLVKKNQKEVNCLFQHLIKDNGYSYVEFCDLLDFFCRPYFHILGGHKLSADVSKTLENLLVYKFPDFYWKVCLMFSDVHPRLISCQVQTSGLSIEKSIAMYEDFKKKLLLKWVHLNVKELKKLESLHSSYVFERNKRISDYKIMKHPFVECFQIPRIWNEGANRILGKTLNFEDSFPLVAIAIIPSFNCDGLSACALSFTDMIIMEIAEFGVIERSDMMKALCKKYPLAEKDDVMSMFSSEINFLFMNKMLFRI